MAKVKKTFRIEEDAYDELVELSAGWGVAQGAAIERAIRLADRCQTLCQTLARQVPAPTAAVIRRLSRR